MSIKIAILLRVRIAFLVVFLLALAVLVKLIDIQYWSGDKWAAKSEKLSIRTRDIKATRGNIYSDNGGLLATSIPTYKLAFDPSVSLRDERRKLIFEDNIVELTEKLADFFNEHNSNYYYRKIKNARKQGRRYLRLSNKSINYHEKKILSTWPIFKEGSLRGGVIFEKQERRLLPFKDLGRRTIGKVAVEADTAGKAIKKGFGLEFCYDSLLAGTPGRSLFTKVGSGWRQLHDASEVKPQHGLDVVTTIDVNIQDVSETALQEALAYHEADNGCVIVMEVATGEIKAIANLSYKKSGPFKGKFLEDYNYAIGQTREPGSTFKLASLMAALSEDRSIELSDSIDTGNGRYKFAKGAVMTDSKNGGYGMLSIEQVFEKSSNIGVSKLVYDIFGSNLKKQQRFYNYLAEFGLVEPIPFQINNDANPKIKKVDDWSGVSLPWMSIGYELEVSPLQTLTFYNGVANNGRMISPILVKKVKRASKIYHTYEPEVIRKKLCSDKVLKKLQAVLAGVVGSKHGTARSIRTPYYAIAGKTGTAKKIVNGKYTNDYYSSFAGYFPADNPKYSIIVTVDNPREHGKYGGQVAAPVFRKISDNIFAQDMDLNKAASKEFTANREIYPVVQAGNFEDLAFLLDKFKVSSWNEDISETWVKAYIDSELKTIKWSDRYVESGKVPDVRGMRLRDALFILENLGLRVQFTGRGRVSKQSLLPDSKLLVGNTINLALK